MVGGKLSDLSRRKWIICVSEGLESVFILGFAFSSSVEWAIFTYVTFVAADSLDNVVPSAWIADMSKDEERGWRMGFFMAFASLAMIPGSLFGGWLYSLVPRAVFYFEATMSMVAMLMTSRLRE
jgi:MFS family permease